VNRLLGRAGPQHLPRHRAAKNPVKHHCGEATPVQGARGREVVIDAWKYVERDLRSDTPLQFAYPPHPGFRPTASMESLLRVYPGARPETAVARNVVLAHIHTDRQSEESRDVHGHLATDSIAAQPARPPDGCLREGIPPGRRNVQRLDPAGIQHRITVRELRAAGEAEQVEAPDISAGSMPETLERSIEDDVGPALVPIDSKVLIVWKARTREMRCNDRAAIARKLCEDGKMLARISRYTVHDDDDRGRAIGRRRNVCLQPEPFRPEADVSHALSSSGRCRS